MSNAPPIHDGIARLAFLLGTWRGNGRGEYPTIDAFTYNEEVTIGHVGKPVLAYTQRTSSPEGLPLHSEMGYFRLAEPDVVEVVIAQPSGITEVHVGTLAGTALHLRAVDVGRTPSAKSVVAVARTITVDGDHLQYRLDMAAVGQELQFHLEAVLRRVSD